jgi:hypothetical protein
LSTDIFWGEIAPCEHLVQIYENPTAFLDSLEGFVAGGLRAGDGVVVIALPGHRLALADRLAACGFDLEDARARAQYIDLDADETLAQFMRDDSPDEKLFQWLVADLLARAGHGGRRVRAFGEMVAVLWGNGHNDATFRLEQLWHELCQEKAFSLFCAYPRTGFTQDAESSIAEICRTHSRVVPASRRASRLI